MTKNLFLLFSIYFFVIQAAILWYLTTDPTYYKLAGINAVAIFLISFVYQLCTKSPKKESKTSEKKSPILSEKAPEIHKEASLSSKENEIESHKIVKTEKAEPTKETFAEKTSVPKMVHPVTPSPKRRKKKNNRRGQRIIFFLTIAIAIAIHLFITCEFLTYRSPILCLIIGFILFLIIGKILDVNGFTKTTKLITSRLYYFILLLSLGYAGMYMYGQGEIIEQYIPELGCQTAVPSTNDKNNQINKEETDIKKSDFDNNDYIYEGSWEILSGFSEIEEITSGTTSEINPIGSGSNPWTGQITQTTSGTNNPTINEPDTSVEITNITMVDALKHIIDANAIPLSTKTDVSFSSLTSSNEDYKYFKTAYEKRMIGKNTEPYKQISCETYIVIKGLAENRSVGNYTDIKAAYRKKAEELNKLNGCQKGGRVTSATL